MNEIINIVLLDGNQKALEVYSKLCRIVGDNYGYTMNVKPFCDSQSFLFEMSDSVFMHTTDILIIDPELVGEAIPKTIRNMGYKGVILYLTSSDEMMVSLRAFDANAFNVLQKGETHLKRFETIMKKALTRAGDMRQEYILLKNRDECIRLSLRDIYYFAAFDHVITAVHNSGSFEFRTSMSELEERLSRYGFVRVNQSYLAAVSYIMSATYETLTLADGTEISIGRKYYPQLKKYANNAIVIEANNSDENDTEEIAILPE